MTTEKERILEEDDEGKRTAGLKLLPEGKKSEVLSEKGKRTGRAVSVRRTMLKHG